MVDHAASESAKEGKYTRVPGEEQCSIDDTDFGYGRWNLPGVIEDVIGFVGRGKDENCLGHCHTY